MIRINVGNLGEIFSMVLKKLNDEGYKEVVVDSDYYRIITADKWEDFNSDSIVIGSLVDDYESLMALIQDSEIPCTYVDFDRLASILHAISQEINPPFG